MNRLGPHQFVIAALCGGMIAGPAAGDSALATNTVSVEYTISFWDIPFGHTKYDGTISDKSYTAKAHFETSGIVGVLWKSVIDATAQGDIIGHSVAPEVYDSYARNRDKPLQRVKVTFERDDPATFADPPYDMTTYPVTDEQKKDAVDPMSAATSLLIGQEADAKHPCGTGVKVFDGRRRYDVALQYIKDEPIKLKPFAGPAHLCRIYFRHIAGYRQEIIAQDKDFPPMYGYFADVHAAVPNRHYVIAVQLWSARLLGRVTVTLDTIKIDGVTPNDMDGQG